MRLASRGPMRGGRPVAEKSSHVRTPDRQSRSSVRYPTPSMWTKVSRIILDAGAGSPPHIRSGEMGECARKPKSERPHGPRVFEVRDRDGLARIGTIETRHGRVTTPALLPVVNPNRPIVSPADLAKRCHAEILITNAYILGKGPSRDRALREGVHALLGFPGAVMTDSGAFQSHVYGDVDVTNAEVIEFQKSIGTDLGTMLDVFSEPSHDRDRAFADIDETIHRAKEADSLRGDMALVGAVQGGLHPDLRERCAREVSSLGVSVCAIGGVVPLLESYRFRDLVGVIIASKKGLDPSKPVHLFGAGHPMVFPLAVLLGCDLFDSASYAKYARDGRMLFPEGTRRASELRETGCACPICTEHSIGDIAANETLLAEHNLHVCFAAVREVRRAIAQGDLWELVERRARAHPSLLGALRELRQHNAFLEESEPISRRGALYYVGPETAHRPILHRFRRRAIERYRPPPSKGLRVRATAEFQFGLGAADALLRGLISYVVSKNNGKVRNVLADGEHVLSLRAEDGLFTLKAAGARRLRAAFPSPRLRVIVEPDSVPFQRDGKNVFAGFVRDADPEIRPGDEVLVVSPEDDLCAVAQATMNRREMVAFKRGVAARVREGVPPPSSAPRR